MATVLSRFEQFEIWQQNGTRWDFLAAFQDFDIANAMARSRSHRVRLMHVVYEGGKAVEKDVLADIGTTRTE